MRLSRVVTVLAATVTATVALTAASVPSSADTTSGPATSPAIISPVIDPLRPLETLVSSDVDLNEVASIGTVAINTDAITNAISINWDVSRPIYISRYLDNTGTISGYCTYTRSGLGVGDAGGGVTFTVAGEATAVGRYKGVEIIATGLRCTLYKPDMTISVGPEWAPGSVVAASTSRSSWDARGGLVCAEAWALLRTVPAGMSSALVSTGMSCH